MTIGKNARAALKWVCYSLLLLLCFGLQSSPALLRIGDIKPVLIIPAAISVALGIIFGMYPAIKASGLQPVNALRAE